MSKKSEEIVSPIEVAPNSSIEKKTENKIPYEASESKKSEHNPDLKLDGVNMISSYIVSHPNHIPSQFKAMNLQNGTWIASYKIDNPTVWNKIKKGEFSGYSVEGYFDQKEIKLKQI